MSTSIVIPCYKRVDHLEKLLDSLTRYNHRVIVSSDYSDIHKDSVKEVRKLVAHFPFATQATYRFSESKLGLKNNIRSSIDFAFKFSEKVIVIEDDLILADSFIPYMNQMLREYENSNEVMHVSGYTRGVTYSADEDVYFHPRPESWGWGTWKSKWSPIEDVAFANVVLKSPKIRESFNCHGSDLDANLLEWSITKERNIDSWLIWWYLEIFKRNGLCVNPRYNLVKQNGFDETGTHCSGSMNWKENFKHSWIPINIPDPYINMEAYQSRASMSRI